MIAKDDVVHVDVTHIGKEYKAKPYGFIEFWNPTVDQLLNLVSYLENNSTIAFVWLYGDPESIEDYSPLFEQKIGRVVEPMWLGYTKETAYAVYKEVRRVYIGDDL